MRENESVGQFAFVIRNGDFMVEPNPRLVVGGLLSNKYMMLVEQDFGSNITATEQLTMIPDYSELVAKLNEEIALGSKGVLGDKVQEVRAVGYRRLLSNFVRYPY